MKFQELKTLESRRKQKLRYFKEKLSDLELEKARLEANEAVYKHPLMVLLIGIFVFLYQQFFSAREELGLFFSYILATLTLAFLAVTIIVYFRRLRKIIEHKYILEIVISEKKEYKENLKSKMRFL